MHLPLQSHDFSANLHMSAGQQHVRCTFLANANASALAPHDQQEAEAPQDISEGAGRGQQFLRRSSKALIQRTLTMILQVSGASQELGM